MIVQQHFAVFDAQIPILLSFSGTLNALNDYSKQDFSETLVCLGLWLKPQGN